MNQSLTNDKADSIADSDWTCGGDQLVYQSCRQCAHAWYFRRNFCPSCGAADPIAKQSDQRGTVHARTLVHRAPTDEFRAAAPYCIVLVDLDDGIRVMGHAEQMVAIGDRVDFSVRSIAGRQLPFFSRNSG